MASWPQSGSEPPTDSTTGASLQRFLEQSLPSRRRQKLHQRFPDVMVQIMSGEIGDEAAVHRILDGDEALLWVMHVVIHTSSFVRVLTWRCRSFCGRPCHAPSLKELPCDWAERALWDYFVSLTPIGEGRPLLRDFLKYAPDDQGLVDWMIYKLHYNFHYQSLRKAGFIPPEPSRMPKVIRALAEQDPGYRTIWVHRWYWGNNSIDPMAAMLGLRADDPGLRRMIDEVDKAFLGSREVKSLTHKYKALKQIRQESGIPPRFELDR